MSITGRIHSLESFGAVDGPGVRFVVFFQGCPLRCLFCHNPDSWDTNGGMLMEADRLAENILSYKNYLSGGVTFSGGEPLLQSVFCEALMDQLQENGMHIAIDTSGAIPPENVKNILDKADLLLLDIKSIDPTMCKTITRMDNHNALKTLHTGKKSANRFGSAMSFFQIIHLIIPCWNKWRKNYKSFPALKKLSFSPFIKWENTNGKP